jgi:hypothetical protein
MLLYASCSDNPINNMASVSASISSEKLHPALVAAKKAIIKFQRKCNVVKQCVVNSYTFYQLAKRFYPNACLKAVMFVSGNHQLLQDALVNENGCDGVLMVHMIVALDGENGTRMIDPSAETDLVEGQYFAKYSALVAHHPQVHDMSSSTGEIKNQKELLTKFIGFTKDAQRLTRTTSGYQFDGEFGKYQSDLENYLVEKGLIRIYTLPKSK